MTTPTGPPKSSYTVHKQLSERLYLVRRTADGETLLGSPLDAADDDDRRAYGYDERARLAGLIRWGAARPAANVLNHENILSIRDEMVSVPFRGQQKQQQHPQPGEGQHGEEQSGDGDGGEGGGGGGVRRMLLWDWPDAGTLQDVFDMYEPSSRSRGGAASEGGFLPESFVWHVGLGLLRALQWLHEGVRDTYDVVAAGSAASAASGAGAVAVAQSSLLSLLSGGGASSGGGGGGGGRGGVSGGGGGDSKGRCKRVRGTTQPEADWMPVLHRHVVPENVYLQHPKGIETYGAVKLGNFGRCFVSGSVAGKAETPVVAMEWEDGVSLAELRERLGKWKKDGLGLYETQRPYTRGSELFAVGALLYRMMCGRPLPPAEECPSCGCVHLTSNDAVAHVRCRHACEEDVNIDEVFRPLSGYTAGLKQLVTLLLRLNRDVDWTASVVLDIAWKGFETWAASTDDGRIYRDVFDDIWVRRQNEKQTQLKKRQLDVVVERASLDIDWDVLVI